MLYLSTLLSEQYIHVICYTILRLKSLYLPFIVLFTNKVGVLRPVQQPGSYWDRSSELPLVGLEPTEVTAYD